MEPFPFDPSPSFDPERSGADRPSEGHLGAATLPARERAVRTALAEGRRFEACVAAADVRGSADQRDLEALAAALVAADAASLAELLQGCATDPASVAAAGRSVDRGRAVRRAILHVAGFAGPIGELPALAATMLVTEADGALGSRRAPASPGGPSLRVLLDLALYGDEVAATPAGSALTALFGQRHLSWSVWSAEALRRHGHERARHDHVEVPGRERWVVVVDDQPVDAYPAPPGVGLRRRAVLVRRAPRLAPLAARPVDGEPTVAHAGAGLVLARVVEPIGQPLEFLGRVAAEAPGGAERRDTGHEDDHRRHAGPASPRPARISVRVGRGRRHDRPCRASPPTLPIPVRLVVPSTGRDRQV